jgi:hypothetical protein
VRTNAGKRAAPAGSGWAKRPAKRASTRSGAYICWAIEQRVLGRFGGAGGAPTAVVGAAIVQRGAGRKGVGAPAQVHEGPHVLVLKAGRVAKAVGHRLRETGFTHAVGGGGREVCVRGPNAAREAGAHVEPPVRPRHAGGAAHVEVARLAREAANRRVERVGLATQAVEHADAHGG